MRWIARTAALLTVMMIAIWPLGSAREAQARLQQAPSSRVVLDLPEGFSPSPLFSGFVSEAIGASFVVVEMPAAAYDQVARGMTAEALEAKGVRNARASTLARAEPYVFIEAEQSGPAGEFAKLMLVFREAGVTALVTANVRKTALAEGLVSADVVRRALASASIAAEPAPAREVFTLGYLGPFKAAGAILGTTRAFTLDGRIEPQAKGQARPILIVAPSLDRRLVTEPDSYAERLLEGLPGLSQPKIEDRRRLEIAGMDSVEMVGTATDKDGGAQIAVYQVLLLPRGGGYYRIVGQMPTEERDRLLPEMRRIAAGFKPVE
ncbi:MAG: hypothetical protein SFW09_20485 [Hyphomicrobiaceae bacterium]|nr:hypothetical protein [Hyphomicrobiaceae bacterium]